MTEQKLISVYVDPATPSEAMERIRSAAGEGSWRIVSIVSFGDADAAQRVSPGINDPRRLQGRQILVLLEEEGSARPRPAHQDLLKNVN